MKMIDIEKKTSSENIKHKLLATKICIVILVGVLLVGISYVAVALFLNNKFCFGTFINDVNCSGKTVEQAEELFLHKIDSYKLTIEQRNGKSEIISPEEIDMKIDARDGLDKIISAQSPYKWILYIFNQSNNNIDFNISYNEEKLNEKLSNLDCLNTEMMTAPTNAHIAYNENSGKFEIINEDDGTTVNINETKAAVISSIGSFAENLNLEESGLYINAEVKADDEKLQKDAEIMNKYILVTITYNFGDKTEIVDREKIKDWLYVNSDGEVDFDKDKVDDFVQYLARTYNTFGITRNFKTSYDSHVVSVSGGDYGWWLNKAAESESLIAVIKEGNDIIKEPIYLQKAASYGIDDMGNTYAEVNLGTQHMFFYKDGKKVFESDFVSGKPSTNHATPTGVYSVTYKQLNATLRGENYATPVKYWMPFNKDIGFHDASWQSSFGNKRYITHGSHGCINLPPNAAKELYSYISKGDPVVVYNYIPAE